MAQGFFLFVPPWGGRGTPNLTLALLGRLFKAFGNLELIPALLRADHVVDAADGTPEASLIDTTDGVMMLGAYDWAFVKPMRKLYYNMTITLVSVIVAVLIGGIEALGLLGDQLALKGAFWEAIGKLNDNFNNLGFVIIGVFVLAWIVSYAIYRLKGLDDVDVHTATKA